MPQMCLEPRTNTNQPQAEWVRTVRNWHLFKSDKVVSILSEVEWHFLVDGFLFCWLKLQENASNNMDCFEPKKPCTSGTATKKWDPNSSLLSCCKLIPFRSTGGVERIIPRNRPTSPFRIPWIHHDVMPFTDGIPIRWIRSVGCTVVHPPGFQNGSPFARGSNARVLGCGCSGGQRLGR